jgi:hypothetical protein
MSRFVAEQMIAHQTSIVRLDAVTHDGIVAGMEVSA